jgi:glycosyltransferase involved in cell wall biosynthesis
MIPVFNAAEFLRETLESVLRQDPGPDVMDIEVVDNCSTEDDPESVVRAIAGERVRFYRQARNVGAIENFNTCIRRARGQWIHILHADDTLLPGFYASAQRAIAAYPNIGAVVCRHLFVDEEGTWLSLSESQARTPGILGDDFVERQLTGQRLHFVGLIVRRSVYEELGGFRAKLQHCSDWDMWNRIVLHAPIFYDPTLLACNRLHPSSGTSHMISTGKNVREERLCVRISCANLPRKEAKRLYRRGMGVAAIRALRHVLQHWKKRDARTASRQFVEALRCGISAMTIGLVYRLTPPERGADASPRADRSGQARVSHSEAHHSL